MYRPPQPSSQIPPSGQSPQTSIPPIHPRIMADLSREQLRQILENLGETPNPRWTKVELRHRISEKTGEDMGRNVKSQAKALSPCQQLVKELNKASGKRKADLIQFCLQTLKMSEREVGHKTIPQLHSSPWSRPGRVWQAPQLPLPGDPSRAQKLRLLGVGDLRGRGDVHGSEAAPVGVVARGPVQRGDAGGCAQDQHLQGVPEGQESAAEQGGIELGHLFDRARGPQGDAGRDQGAPERDQGSQARAYSQEGHEGRGERRRNRGLVHEGEHQALEDDSDPDDESGPSMSASLRVNASDGPPLSASEKLSQQLSLGKARRLEEQAWSVVPQVFQGLVAEGRTILMEVCCSPESLLTSTVQHLTGESSSASRCSHWNCGDLSSNQGLKHVLQRLEVENPSHVWLSPPCGPYSPLQNGNCRTLNKRASSKKSVRSL